MFNFETNKSILIPSRNHCLDFFYIKVEIQKKIFKSKTFAVCLAKHEQKIDPKIEFKFIIKVFTLFLLHFDKNDKALLFV